MSDTSGSGWDVSWNTNSLKEYVEALLSSTDRRYEQRFSDQEKAVSAALAAADRATTKADVAYEKRFDAQNEFREQLNDQARQFMPRAEAELQQRALEGRLNALEKLADRGGGRSAGREQVWGYVIGAVGVLAALVAVLATLTR